MASLFSVSRTQTKKLLQKLKFCSSHLIGAESCTGGLIASKICAIDGASSVLKGCYVVYTNEMKSRMLGVSRKTLEKFGAISKETVSELLCGLIDLKTANLGYAISGYCGTSAPTDGQKIGDIFAGFFVEESSVERRKIEEKSAEKNSKNEENKTEESEEQKSIVEIKSNLEEILRNEVDSKKSRLLSFETKKIDEKKYKIIIFKLSLCGSRVLIQKKAAAFVLQLLYKITS